MHGSFLHLFLRHNLEFSSQFPRPKKQKAKSLKCQRASKNGKIIMAGELIPSLRLSAAFARSASQEIQADDIYSFCDRISKMQPLKYDGFSL